jgi:hypothetical protein
LQDSVIKSWSLLLLELDFSKISIPGGETIGNLKFKLDKIDQNWILM